MTGPHDKFVKQMFSNVEHAAVELRAVLPPALLTHPNLSTLQVCPGSFVDRRLRQVHSDLLYSVQIDTHKAYIYVLLEHQSTPDATMPFRLLEYLVKIWREHIERADETPSAPWPFVRCFRGLLNALSDAHRQNLRAWTPVKPVRSGRLARTPKPRTHSAYAERDPLVWHPGRKPIGF